MTALTRGSGRWLFLGAFALLGLFAMHGLGSHGMSHAAGDAVRHAEGHVVAHSAGTIGPGHAEGQPQQRPEGHPALAACGSDCGDEDGLMALCLAVLGASAAAVLAFGLLLLLAPPALRPPRWVGTTRAILRSARGPGPPGRFALSVQRC